MAISFANLNNSGYDFAAITEQLAEFEKQTIVPYQARVTQTSTKITGMGSLKNVIDALRTATEKLAAAMSSAPAKTSVSGNGVSVTAGAGAVAGSYSIFVDQLAAAGSLKSAAIDSRTAQNGVGGTIAIETVGGTAPINIELGSDTSLNGVRDAINAKSDSPVNATIITDGEGKSFLMLTSRATGEKAEVKSIDVTGNSGTLAADLNYAKGGTPGNMTVANVATDAKLTLNGIAITSGSNQLTTAIDNLTLDLSAVTETGKKVTVKVESDIEAQVTAVQNFVTAYNAMRTTTKTLSTYNKDSTSINGSLYADSTLRSAQDELASGLRVATDDKNIFSLAKLGITTDIDAKDGTLKIDVAKVRDAITKYPSEVSNLLSGTEGLATKMNATTKQYLDQGSIKGKITSVVENLESERKKQTKAVEDVTARVEATNAATIAQFNALSVALSKIESTKNYLTSQFEAIANSNKK